MKLMEYNQYSYTSRIFYFTPFDQKIGSNYTITWKGLPYQIKESIQLDVRAEILF